MAFEQELPRVPTSIPYIEVRLIDRGVYGQEAAFELFIHDANGIVLKILQGDLVPHLTPTQINGLQNFMADLRTMAEGQIL